MTKLSLGMIVKNEEETLERVLTCAKAFCDELVVVDTGSTDKSIEIAEAMGAKVLHFTWQDDFALARNYAFDHCTGEWIIWLDADDVVPEAEQKKIIELKQNHLNDGIDGVFFTYCWTQDTNGNPAQSFQRERMIRRAACLKWEQPIHEYIYVASDRALYRPDISVYHQPLEHKVIARAYRNINILETLIQKGDRSPRTLFCYANELMQHERFPEAIATYEEYLQVSDIPWERYMSMMSLVKCSNALNQFDMAFEWCMRAIAFDSSRAEAFNEAGIYFYNHRQFEKAVPLFNAALHCSKPEFGFVNDIDYLELPTAYLKACKEYMGQSQL